MLFYGDMVCARRWYLYLNRIAVRFIELSTMFHVVRSVITVRHIAMCTLFLRRARYIHS